MRRALRCRLAGFVASLFLGGVAISPAFAKEADAWFRDALRRDNPENAWCERRADRALYWERVLATSRAFDSTLGVSPFVNTSSGRVTLRRESREPVRVCACYLPENLRSWNGGPLSEQEILSLCMRQCF